MRQAGCFLSRRYATHRSSPRSASCRVSVALRLSVALPVLVSVVCSQSVARRGALPVPAWSTSGARFASV